MANYDLSTVDWFEWNGVKCTTSPYGIHVLTQPQILRATERVEQIMVPGRAGALTFLEGEDVYEQINMAVACTIDNPGVPEDPEIQAYGYTGRIDAITRWLRGQGEVRFANRTEGYYKGRIVNQFGFDKILRGNPNLSFQVLFTVDPFCYLLSGLTKTKYTTSPATLNNLGGLQSLPLLKVTGTSSGTIMCGDSSMIILDFTGVSYIMLDCDAKICYTGQKGNPNDPLKLLGTRVTGEWLTIPIGQSYLSFTGGITSVEVVPRWRSL